jgi:glycosyltransferase involved in cell wall biosynthesis
MNQSQKLRPTLGVVIRFKNSATTLPAVVEALSKQTRQPELIIGVNNGSTDASASILSSAGARIIDWTKPYSHPQVLNFALNHCHTDLILVLSSHTVLNSTDAVEKLAGSLTDPRTACASGKWDSDPFYSDAIDWNELKTKGLKFGSIYTNSMGLLRRSLWEQCPFDESISTMEDCVWALEQVRRGHLCRRVQIDFSYQRSTTDRTFVFAAHTFQLAARHDLRVTWLGPIGTIRSLISGTFDPHVLSNPTMKQERRNHLDRLKAWAYGRWKKKLSE